MTNNFDDYWSEESLETDSNLSWHFTNYIHWKAMAEDLNQTLLRLRGKECYTCTLIIDL